MERRDAQPRYEGDAFLPSYNARMQSVGFSQPQQDFSSRAVDQRTSSNSVNGTDQYYSSQYYNRSEEQLQQRSVHQGQVYPSTRSAPPPQLPSYTMPKPPTYDYRGAH